MANPRIEELPDDEPVNAKVEDAGSDSSDSEAGDGEAGKSCLPDALESAFRMNELARMPRSPR